MKRSRRLVWAVVAVAVVVVAGATVLAVALSSDDDRESTAADTPFLSALHYVPVDVTDLGFTDWATLRHPDRLPLTTGVFAGDWIRSAGTSAAQVSPTDADWEIDFTPNQRARSW